MPKTITIPGEEWFNENTQEFGYSKPVTIQIEHSLVSISKWEANWNKPFLTKTNRTIEETIDYIRCMTITQNVDPEVYNRIPSKIMQEIMQYIEAPMSATTITKRNNKGSSRQIVTSELIYCWMIQCGIPFTCEKWHLARLIKLIEVCNAESGPQQKMGNNELMARNKALNAKRRAAAHSRG